MVFSLVFADFSLTFEAFSFILAKMLAVEKLPLFLHCLLTNNLLAYSLF